MEAVTQAETLELVAGENPHHITRIDIEPDEVHPKRSPTHGWLVRVRRQGVRTSKRRATGPRPPGACSKAPSPMSRSARLVFHRPKIVLSYLLNLALVDILSAEHEHFTMRETGRGVWKQ